MRRAAIRSTAPTTRLVAVALAGSTALTLALPTLGATAQAAQRNRPTTIVVQGGNTTGVVREHQLGVNHRFVGNGHGMWDPAADAPRAEVVRRLARAGVSDIRFPGGIVGNLYDWKRAIGAAADRECQTSGQLHPTGYKGVAATGYGPDEHMRLVNEIGADATIVVPFATGSTQDAADWVEYMNTRKGDGINPNGGTDWAELRPRFAPYGVRYWEIGNEQRVGKQRYWMSPNRGRAMRQYANGDPSVVIRDEFLSRGCAHPVQGSEGNGRPNQVFNTLYGPVKPGSLNVTVVDPSGATWSSVATLDSASGAQNVYAVNEENGTVSFGDNNRGAVLPRGARVRATYTMNRPGVFDYIRAMKQVDPSINACVTWGLAPFIRVAGARKYDCFAVHAYTNFAAEKSLRWRTAVEGHDRNMLGAADEQNFVQRIKQKLPRGVSLALTEFGAIKGKTEVYPEYTASMTHATYMASQWVSWMNMGIPLAIGNAVVGSSNRALLGPAPNFTLSAEALTRQAIKPLYEPRSRRLGVNVVRNPVRQPRFRNADGYRALSVAATRAPGRELRILVVNRLPNDRVAARVDLRGFNSRGFAFVSTVNGASFRSWNLPRKTEVHLRTDRRGIGRDGFRGVFPAHSVTVIRVPAR